MTTETVSRFSELGLAAPVLQAVDEVGYEAPSPIQAQCIPPLLQGRDLLGTAQTGTGKTAAFALPLLSRLDLSLRQPQILVLTPTRELAIQVAEAMQTYARHLKDFHILPVYGGQGMDVQLRQLRRGVHVVVGTPGRVQDHLRRGTLVLDRLAAVVLDEADEMLRMGFIDDVEQILEKTPDQKQVALFSATMPEPIRRVARKHLREPVEIRIKTKTTTVTTITQRYWQVSGVHKLDALTRMLALEDFKALIIFVRTKTATLELAEKLEARGYSSAALNGDMNQALREKTIERLKSGALDIVVATDVAARGLDVERISHVINYDIPYDTEAYVHRIGRTGRAGRKGEAILFVAPRETRMLRAIERATGAGADADDLARLDELRRTRYRIVIHSPHRLKARLPCAIGDQRGRIGAEGVDRVNVVIDLSGGYGPFRAFVDELANASTRLHQVLAVVQHQQQSLRGQQVHHGVDHHRGVRAALHGRAQPRRRRVDAERERLGQRDEAERLALLVAEHPADLPAPAGPAAKAGRERRRARAGSSRRRPARRAPRCAGGRSWRRRSAAAGSARGAASPPRRRPSRRATA